MQGRPRLWSVYYHIDKFGEIIDISSSDEDILNKTIRCYMSRLTLSESKLLVKMMLIKYTLSTGKLPNEIPSKLMYLKFPPKKHKSRISTSWNKGLKSNHTNKTSSVKANNKVKNKKLNWLIDTYQDKSCIYCHEGESACLIYHPDIDEINKINNLLGINESRIELNKLIDQQDVHCLNCNKKLDIGLELGFNI